jgi:hypothetical protein
MELDYKLDAERFIDQLGGTKAVADLLKIKAPSVSGWKEKGAIPDDKLIRLAPIAEARGVATRKQLFPNDYSAIWPEIAEEPAARMGTDRRDASKPSAYAEIDIDRRAPAETTTGKG